MYDITIPSCKSWEQVQPLIKNIRETVPENWRIIFSGQKVSAAINRNLCHKTAETDIVIMMDDDIAGLYPGWVDDLVKPLLDDCNVQLASARYLKADGKTLNHMMGVQGKPETGLIEVSKLPTALFCYRKADLDTIWHSSDVEGIPFDERFIGSGYEDLALCWDLKKTFKDCKFIVNNDCRVIHYNDMKFQHTDGNFEKNKKLYFMSGRFEL